MGLIIMNFILNEVVPFLILLCFFTFLVYQLLHKESQKKQSGLYYSNSTNSGTKAKTVFETIEKNPIQPDFLGEVQ